MSRAQAADHGAGQEAPERLAQPGAGRVLRCGHPAVVAPVVLDVEVAVRGLGQRHLGQAPLEPVALVPQLVRGVDPHPGDGADREGEPELRPARQPAVHRRPRRPGEAQVLERQVQVGEPAVPAVGLELGHRPLGRVRRVGADERVEHGHQHQDPDGAHPPEHVRARRLDHPAGAEGQQRHDEAQRPQVPLGVAPHGGGLGRAAGVGGTEVGGTTVGGGAGGTRHRGGGRAGGRPGRRARLGRLGHHASSATWASAAGSERAPSKTSPASNAATTSGGSSGALSA